MYMHLICIHIVDKLITGWFREFTSACVQGEADATWVFLGWEGIEADIKGVKLNKFKLEDFNVPYGHSPLLVAHPDMIR